MTKIYAIVLLPTEAVIGFVVLKPPGWFFISNVSSHKGSRVPRATAEGAFPRWARKMGARMVARD